ncbi:hypothetical protein GAS19_11650 [Burkholderia glumae]|nr:hypothetical protein [Burkholderia glumae]QGA38204.1 hypothetical protein GAS19_11650 [Burkholderia glumae]
MSSLDQIRAQLTAAGHPELPPGHPLADGRHHRYGPRKKYWYQLREVVSKLVAPILDITDADAANVAEGSVVVAGGERFRVVSIHPAGTGWTVLVLR